MEVRLIIFESTNGRDNWNPVLPDMVPDWVKEPKIMERLVAGEMCMDVSIGPKGSPFYRAERV